uniref:Large ribosomal subunit protein mL45 n=1 Tax=Clastoptera arizonana TaxID=38151 RepID=A0A1B6D8W5_9HEMI
MSLYKAATSGIKHMKIGPYGLKVPNDVLTNIGILSQVRTSKHWNPKFKKLRSQKVIKVNLPDFEQINKKQYELSTEEVRSKMKENGLFPRRPWIERPLYFSCTGDVFEPYVPPEGDGKVSVISTAGAKQALQFIEKKSKSMLAVRKIRKFEDEFEVDIFLKEAIDIYEKAHEAITTKDEDNILKYSTERAYPEILHNIQNKTIKWKMIKEVERPRLVHARSTDVISKDNVFFSTDGQISHSTDFSSI